MKTRSRSRDWLGNAKSDRSSLVSGVFFASCMRLGGVVGGFGGAAASGEERRKVLQELQRLGLGRFPGISVARLEVATTVSGAQEPSNFSRSESSSRRNLSASR
jgi:hypothetical protein